MERAEIKDKLIGTLTELFEDRNVDTDLLEYVDLIDDMGMDSMTFITIVVEIEAMFGIIVPDEMLLMENFRNVDNVIRVIENAKNAVIRDEREQEGV